MLHQYPQPIQSWIRDGFGAQSKNAGKKIKKGRGRLFLRLWDSFIVVGTKQVGAQTTA